MKQKAEDLAHKFKINDFNATNGWLFRWKVRNQNYSKKIQDEASDADETATNARKINVLPPLLHDYSSSCAYDCDETSLNYRVLPDGTLCLKGKKIVGGKFRNGD